MDATPIDLRGIEPMLLIPAIAPAVGAQGVQAQWDKLHEAAAIVAALAGLRTDLAASTPGIGAAFEAAGDSRQRIASRSIDDICAVLEPGLAALLAVQGSGRDAIPPARALWEEFERARGTVLALLVR